MRTSFFLGVAAFVVTILLAGSLGPSIDASIGTDSAQLQPRLPGER